MKTSSSILTTLHYTINNKHLVFLWCFLSFSSFLNSQSLIANNDFEDINICSEFRAKCAPEAWFRLPTTDVSLNLKDVVGTSSGKHSESIIVGNKNYPIRYRVFLYTMLLCPLQKDTEYTLSLHLNPIHEKQFKLGVLFSNEELISGLHNPIDHQPQLLLENKHSIARNKKSNWYTITITYKAKGGEQFLMFGNFDTTPYPFSPKTICTNRSGDLAYLIDQVDLVPSVPDSTNICMDYEKNKTFIYGINHRHRDKIGIPMDQLSPNLSDSISTDTIFPTPSPSPQVPKIKQLEISSIAFEFDSDLITQDAFPILDSIINIITTLNPTSVLIQGHTDNIGLESYNQSLSKKRAVAIRNYIIKNSMLSPDTFTVEGLGSKQPKVLNDSAANRAKNRRVTLILKYYANP